MVLGEQHLPVAQRLLAGQLLEQHLPAEQQMSGKIDMRELVEASKSKCSTPMPQTAVLYQKSRKPKRQQHTGTATYRVAPVLDGVLALLSPVNLAISLVGLVILEALLTLSHEASVTGLAAVAPSAISSSAANQSRSTYQALKVYGLQAESKGGSRRTCDMTHAQVQKGGLADVDAASRLRSVVLTQSLDP